MDKELLTSSYDFSLPKELIAKYPANPRDSAKLLVYDRAKDKIIHTVFKNILDFIPKDTAVILNNTKVIKARIYGKKNSGGKVELLINKPLDATTINVYIRGKVKQDTKLVFDGITAKVININEDGSRDVVFYHDGKELRFEELIVFLDKIGHMPLPPYIDRDDEKLDEVEYQSVFAKKEGAIAAPTASLHFTDELFEKLKQNHKTCEVTLHVGAGTFKPVDVDVITEHKIHSEYFSIPKATKEILDSDKKILAIGTTATRTIEFYSREKLIKGEANLFLHPKNKPVRVNHLLTNFHLPKSTLIMLVASFIGLDKTKELYEKAVKEKYRFFSYGDAMLII